jgi:hypothetical protein
MVFLAVAMAGLFVERAFALITGGEGNSPIGDPGWPKGAAAIFNHVGRIAWWEGPPFGGGSWHSECRGDANALNAVLTGFAKLDVKRKRVVVHDGVGHSFWLNPNREPAKQEAAKIDWDFMVWQRRVWEQLRNLPADFNPTDARDAESGPPAQVDVFTGGNIRWANVTVPKGIEVVDQRLEAHGFTIADGVVLEGTVFDLATHMPVASRMRLQRIEPQKTGGYRYPVAAETVADALGHWILKKAPSGGYRVVIEAPGYVPRVVGYPQFDDQPKWQSYECALARSASVSGRITDQAGKPLADVDVQFMHVVTDDGGRYESSDEYTCKTDADGRFRTNKLPAGSATVWPRKPTYCRPGLGQPIKVPASDIELSMMKSAHIVVTVDFAGAKRPDGYIVEMKPEGGSAVGKWSGSGNIDAGNQIMFRDVTPGRYVILGHPNPSSADQRSKPINMELKPGQASRITLSAKP